MLGILERKLHGRQYAYRRNRGAGAHLIEFRDFAREANRAGDYVYVASVDMDGAFDTVPHKLLVQTVEQLGVDPYVCRYLHKWLTKRIFTVRLQTATGRCYSSWRGIGRGVPQGGILSPFLWALHVDSLLEQVSQARLEYPAELVTVKACDLLYADDLLCALAHHNPKVLEEAAGRTAGTRDETLGNKGLSRAILKSENFVLPPGRPDEESMFRRHPGQTGVRTRGRPRSAPTDGATRELEIDPMRGAEEPVMHISLPYSSVAYMKILGVTFDRDFTFEGHLRRLLSKAKIRLVLVKRVASQSWGLVVGMLRLTGEALVISLLRYCFAVVGSGLPESLFRRIDNQVINPLARQIAGVGPSARIPVLHAVSGLYFAHNLFTQHCGELLNLSLRAANSSIRERL